MPAVPVQLVFQGGGARLAALLPVCAAFRTAERDGLIRVTRVSGASAGAFAAALYAANLEHAAANALRSRGEAWVRRHFTASTAGALFQILRGVPVFSQEPIRELLTTIGMTGFLEMPATPRPPVFVAVSDVDRREGRALAGTTQSALDALLHSSAIPFAFYGHREVQAHGMLDGGLCENLPVTHLLDEEERYGKVIAVSFQPEAPEPRPKNVKQLAQTVMNIAVNNSVARAIRAVGEDSVHYVDTDLRTFEFNRMIPAALNEPRYSEIQSAAAEWINSWLELRAGSPADYTERHVRAAVSRVSSSLQTAFNIDAARMVVFLHSRQTRRAWDSLIQEFEVTPTAAPMRVFDAAVNSSAEHIDAGTWTVEDIDEPTRQLEVIALPSVAAVRAAGLEAVMLFFPTALAPGRRFKIRRGFRALGALEGISKPQGDFIYHSNTRHTVEIRSDIIVFYPREKVHITGNILNQIPGDPPPPFTLAGANPLSPEQLTAEYGQWLMGYMNWRGIGWRAANLMHNHLFGVNIYSHPPT